jgi:hypothetical protein
LLQKVVGTHYVADGLLERGVLADMSGHPKPQLFKQALSKFKESSNAMSLLDKKLGELIAIHNSGKLEPGFEQALERILGQANAVPRVALSGTRYANAAGVGRTDEPQIKSLLNIMEAQRKDLGILKTQLDEMIAAFGAVIPIAERGEFASTLLSGRQGFADKVQQSVYLTGVFSNFYVSKCMATIDATMQVYPAGLNWLPGGSGGASK